MHSGHAPIVCSLIFLFVFFKITYTYTPPNPLWLEDKWGTQLFKEEVCDNCSCKEE
jgi:hypothetical protein